MSETQLLNAIFAGATALFAFIMCGIVWHQIKTTKNLERAWIVVESIAFGPLWKEKQHFRPILKNVGRSIARIQKISLGGSRPRQSNEELKSPPTYEGWSDLDFALSPQGKLPLLSIPDIPLNRENADSVKRGFLRLYVYGLIEYRDFSGKKRETAFCFKFYPGKDGILDGFHPFLEAPRGYIRAT